MIFLGARSHAMTFYDILLTHVQKFAGNEDDTPVYISLDRTVFDVSGSEFYEKEGPYHIFAGHEASRCLAKMSFAEEDLDSLDLSDLTHADRDSLDGWIMKFRHGKCYPVVGKLVPPPEEPQIFTISELQEYKGEGDIPEGAAAAPIYVAVKGDVFDMSYGGSSHYGKVS
jgi:membrane-associated progesterone receptor component